ncbi:hypothetical protein BaRGS_00017162 [Batillaria attramentaria]|uniref:Insulin-like domain-containing protein n=1 Tax=Batillaria attramentaria TaxID=370345 RepID=A0ABD0KX60_9CAEN
MTTVAGLVVVLLLAMSVATVENRRLLCGRQLADTLDLVCAGRGFHWNKRSVDSIKSHVKRNANAAVPETGVPARSVVDECCRRPCGFHTLESYCATTDNPAPFNGLDLWATNGQRFTTTSSTGFTTTPSTAHYDPNSPSAEVNRGRPRGNKHPFFYVQLGRLVTRNPLITE